MNSRTHTMVLLAALCKNISPENHRYLNKSKLIRCLYYSMKVARKLYLRHHKTSDYVPVHPFHSQCWNKLLKEVKSPTSFRHNIYRGCRCSCAEGLRPGLRLHTIWLQERGMFAQALRMRLALGEAWHRSSRGFQWMVFHCLTLACIHT